jgi:hypothetical protein
VQAGHQDDSVNACPEDPRSNFDTIAGCRFTLRETFCVGRVISCESASPQSRERVLQVQVRSPLRNRFEKSIRIDSSLLGLSWWVQARNLGESDRDSLAPAVTSTPGASFPAPHDSRRSSPDDFTVADGMAHDRLSFGRLNRCSRLSCRASDTEALDSLRPAWIASSAHKLRLVHTRTPARTMEGWRPDRPLRHSSHRR